MPEALKSLSSAGCPGELSTRKHPVPLLILGPNPAEPPNILGYGSIPKASCSKLTLWTWERCHSFIQEAQLENKDGPAPWARGA